MSYDECLGVLYAVVFEQGTVKVGMSTLNPDYRFSAHRKVGQRFGISTVHEFYEEFSTKDVPLRETVLCNMCASVADWHNGFEWFKFPSPEVAVFHLEKFYDRIKNNDFTGFLGRLQGHKYEGRARVNHALLLVKLGHEPREAAAYMHVDTRYITSSKGFRDWKNSNENEGK